MTFNQDLSIRKIIHQLIIRSQFLILLILSCAIFTACNPQDSSRTPINIPLTGTQTTRSTIFSQISYPKNFIDKKTPTNWVIPTYELTKISTFVPISPFESISEEDLLNIVSNPFQTPTKGQDDGHHGVDFSFYSFHEFKSIDNLPIQSILPGKISGLVINRPPYGNAIIIETDLSLLEENILSKIDGLDLPDDIYTSSNLNCPVYSQSELEDATTNDALYILYGHLKSKPEFKIGDEVKQGQFIGNVGNTGFSGNSHLHLEIRIGPPNATFNSLAHYDNSVSSQEMKNYCLWRVSNLFSLFDPLLLFEPQPTKP